MGRRSTTSTGTIVSIWRVRWIYKRGEELGGLTSRLSFAMKGSQKKRCPQTETITKTMNTDILMFSVVSKSYSVAEDKAPTRLRRLL